MMLSVDEALKIVLESAHLRKPENRSIADAAGYCLYENVVAHENVPPFDNSAMDGYAVKASDVQNAARENPCTLKVIEVIRAGNFADKPLMPGQAYQIMTGAPMPEGADAVVMVEQTEKTETVGVKIFSSVLPGENVRYAGDDIKKEQVVFEKGRLIQPYDVGVLASIGQSSVRVISKPKIAILSTGDELAGIDTPLPFGKIRSSNNYTLQALIHSLGIETLDLGVAKDTMEDTEVKLQKAFSSDIVLTSGGVSMGEFDFVKEALKKLGVEIRFWKVKQKPGKPLVFGTFQDNLFFGLPGNPVSCAVCFELFVLPAIKKMSGYSIIKTPRLRAASGEKIEKKPGMRHFLRGIVKKENDRAFVKTTGRQSSGILSSLSYANCLIDLPEECGDVQPGEEVDVIVLNPSTLNELIGS